MCSTHSLAVISYPAMPCQTEPLPFPGALAMIVECLPFSINLDQ